MADLCQARPAVVTGVAADGDKRWATIIAPMMTSRTKKKNIVKSEVRRCLIFFSS